MSFPKAVKGDCGERLQDLSAMSAWMGHSCFTEEPLPLKLSGSLHGRGLCLLALRSCFAQTVWRRHQIMCGALGGQERALDPLELEVQMVVSPQVDAGNPT